jgi:putative transposase
MLDYRPFYQRHLPHYQPPGATLFITFRLAGSLPRAVIDGLLAEQCRIDQELDQLTDASERARRAYRESRRLFGRWDELLAADQNGPHWLAQPHVAELMADSLHYRDERTLRLEAFCIMPNHVHLVCTPLEKPESGYHALTAILHSLKRYTAREANKLLARQGAFWQQEIYDHVVRDEGEFRRIIAYVLNNPIKVGLVATWEEWAWNYVRM